MCFKHSIACSAIKRPFFHRKFLLKNAYLQEVMKQTTLCFYARLEKVRCTSSMEAILTGEKKLYQLNLLGMLLLRENLMFTF